MRFPTEPRASGDGSTISMVHPDLCLSGIGEGWRADARSSWLAHADKAVQARREFLFGVLSLCVILLLQSHWDAPITRDDSTLTISSMVAGVASGDLARRILGLIAGGIGFIWLCRFSTRRLHLAGAYSLAAIAWVSLLCASILWSADPSLTIRRLALLLLLLLSASALASLHSARIFALVLLAAVLSLVSGIFCELYWGTFHPFSSGYRFGGAAHPNLQGTCLATGILGAIGYAFSTRRHRRLAAFAGFLCAVALLLTNSRTALGALAIAGAFGGILLFLRRTPRRLRPHIVICLLCGAAALGIAATTLHLSDLAMHSVAEKRDEGNTDSLNGRAQVWAICLRYAEQRPLLGYGYDSFWSADHVATVSSEAQWPVNEAHSVYIDEILNEGLLGTLLFTFLIFACLLLASRRFLQGRNTEFGWAILFVFILVHGISESILMPVISFPAYMIMVGIARFALLDDRSSHAPEFPGKENSRGYASYS